MILLIGFNSNAQVVISQVYGGGGNSGAQYYNDFVELFNRGTSAVDISGWSIQYVSATGPTLTPFTWAVNAIPASTSIAAGKYFLIKLAAGSTTVGQASLPSPDLDITTAPLALSATTGKVALVNNATPLSNATQVTGSWSYVDLFGYGSGATGYEGTPTAALSNSTSATRLIGGCTDNNNNSTDFTIGVPSPRNSATAANICSTDPSLSITSPANAAIFNPLTASVTVNISVSNYTVAPGVGHIHYTVDSGGAIMKYDTAPIVLNGLAAGDHTVSISLVDVSHAQLSPAVLKTVTFNIATFTPVANIAALRNDVITNGYGKYYEVSNTPTVTYARSATYRNQKYVQDSSAAMLIDDSSGIITTTPIVIGDNLAGLKGQSLNYLGVLEFVPIANATVSSSNNSILPEVVTAAAISANIEAYESELVLINGLTFATGNGTAAFTTTSADYATTDAASTALIFRSMFLEANYLVAGSNIIPSGANNVIVLVSENNGVAKVVSRSSNDLTLATTQNEITGLKVYPNPVSNGVLHIESNLSTERTISLFDVLGKQVLNTTTSNNTINVAALNSGVYIVKITEGSNTATRKVIIR